MSLTPQMLLSNVAREACVAKLKELPKFVNQVIKGKQQTASVLVPICVDSGEVCLLYTLRSSNLKHHSGQVSFPGGKTDENESAYDTALRETEEEIGIPRDNIDVWGEMPLVEGRNKDVVITPIVGVINNFDFKNLRPNVEEVEEIFTVPMKVLCNPQNHAHFNFEKYMIPVFLNDKHKVWGITGLITHLFLQSFLPESTYKADFMRKKFRLDELMPAKL